jgi:hypothetical protein
MDNCAISFPNFIEIFPELSRIQTVLPYRPNGRTLAERNFLIEAWRVRMIDLMHAISIYEACASGA